MIHHALSLYSVSHRSYRGILKSCFKWNDTVECFKGSSEVGANQCYLEYHNAIDQYKKRGINVAMYNDPSSNKVYLEYICLVMLLLFMNVLIYIKAWLLNRSFEKKANQAEVVGTNGLPQSRPRRGSITNEILSRFDEDSQHRRMSTARRLSASFRSMVFKSELQGEEGAANEEAAVDAEAASRPRTQRLDSTREFVMKRLQSSNVLTWK